MLAQYNWLTRQVTLLTLLLSFIALTGSSPARAQPISADINVMLRPVVEKIPLVTDINVYTSINTNGVGDRIFVGGFKNLQFITNQLNNPLGSNNLAGALYEVVPK